jgi:hypothetical protein
MNITHKYKATNAKEIAQLVAILKQKVKAKTKI